MVSSPNSRSVASTRKAGNHLVAGRSGTIKDA
jgi:hypothetical protein